MPVLSLACHLPHNTPHIPSRYNNEQTTKQTKAINNSYIYINISCKCDTNRAGHFTLDAYASRPVACNMSLFHWDEPRIYANCLVHDCSISTANALKILQPCTKPSIDVTCALTHWGRDKMAAIFADDIFICIFLNENFWISYKISLEYVPYGLIDMKPSLIHITGWRRTGDRPLSEPL